MNLQEYLQDIENRVSAIFDRIDPLHHSMNPSDPHFADIDAIRSQLMALNSAVKVTQFFSQFSATEDEE